MKSIRNFFDPTERELKRLDSVVQSINAMEPEMQALSDSDLRGKTEYFQAKLRDGATLEDILGETFAVVRETSRRVLGMRHFDVQLLGGIILHQGRIAE
ncbi:MAG TPA: preprotein translocase subunit SecA, partial [Firmicutes bacterium]|nr:preprotein translocase subunit SecA [Bacillota bacterium]